MLREWPPLLTIPILALSFKDYKCSLIQFLAIVFLQSLSLCSCLIDAMQLAQLGFVLSLCCVLVFSLCMSLLFFRTSKKMSLGCDEYSISSLQS